MSISSSDGEDNDEVGMTMTAGDDNSSQVESVDGGDAGELLAGDDDAGGDELTEDDAVTCSEGSCPDPDEDLEEVDVNRVR